MKTIAFFNNKGGVGKTTLASNIAAHFSRSGHKTVVIDCDPQCNSTLLILGDDFFLAALDSQKINIPAQTILDIVQPIQDGDPDPNIAIEPHAQSTNRFQTSIVPGHPRLALIEDKLSQAWSQLNAGDIGGLRTSNWFFAVTQALSPHYDVALVDLGPSLGSLNRSVLIGADYFVTPMGCDIFSLIGIRNISEWLGDWLALYENGLKFCAQRNKNSDLSKYSIVERPTIASGFAGYTVQQYVTKATGGVRRPTVAYEKILKRIDGEMDEYLSPFSPRPSSPRKKPIKKLGDVPNMYSLIPLAQSVNAPISMLNSSDGLRGSQFKQAEHYGEIIDDLAKNLAKSVGLK